MPAAAPVFVLTVPRSYSTVTSALLGGHPQIWAFPETGLLTAPTVGALLSGVPFAHLPKSFAAIRESGVLRAVAEINDGDQSPASIARARAWLTERAHFSGTWMMRHLFEAVAPAVPLEKSTDVCFGGAGLHNYLEFHPDARFIHVVRHPVASQKSIQRLLADIGATPDEAEQARFANESWRRGNTNLAEELATLGPSRSRRIRGEDLLDDPTGTLRELLEWLGLNADPSVIEAMLRTEQWRFGHTGEDDSLYGGDRSFLTSPRLRPAAATGPLSAPESWRLAPEAWAGTTALAHRLGYPPVSHPEPSYRESPCR